MKRHAAGLELLLDGFEGEEKFVPAVEAGERGSLSDSKHR
jgi:hypothetical protein